MNNTIPFHSATHAPQITVDVNILTMLKRAASCLTEAAGKDVYLAAIGPDMELTIIMEEDRLRCVCVPAGAGTARSAANAPQRTERNAAADSCYAGNSGRIRLIKRFTVVNRNDWFR